MGATWPVLKKHVSGLELEEQICILSDNYSMVIIDITNLNFFIVMNITRESVFQMYKCVVYDLILTSNYKMLILVPVSAGTY